jgi:hypothetical protein
MVEFESCPVFLPESCPVFLPWYLRWLAGKSYPKEEDDISGPQGALHSKLREILPTLPEELNYPHWNLTEQWLKHELETQPTFDAMVLARFDQIMIPDLHSQKDGLIEEDRRLVKWFNRLDDVDIDEWLGAHAPKSLEYRRRTISGTGVDPLTAYADQAVDAERRGLLFKALPAAEAQECLELLNVVFPNNIDDPRKRPPQSDAKVCVRPTPSVELKSEARRLLAG